MTLAKSPIGLRRYAAAVVGGGATNEGEAINEDDDDDRGAAAVALVIPKTKPPAAGGDIVEEVCGDMLLLAAAAAADWLLLLLLLSPLDPFFLEAIILFNLKMLLVTCAVSMMRMGESTHLVRINSHKKNIHLVMQHPLKESELLFV